MSKPKNGPAVINTHGTSGGYVSGCRCETCTEAHRAYVNQWRSTEDGRKKDRATAQKWRDANPENVKEMHKRYHEANSEKRNAYVAQWRRDNPERARLLGRRSSQLRHARKARADHGCVSVEAYLGLYKATDWRCIYCGDPAEHMDHVHPLARGGLHCVENLAPACAPCNWSKNAKILDDPPASLMECPLKMEEWE